mgnify:CR=1 FL=1
MTSSNLDKFLLKKANYMPLMKNMKANVGTKTLHLRSIHQMTVTAKFTNHFAGGNLDFDWILRERKVLTEVNVILLLVPRQKF